VCRSESTGQSRLRCRQRSQGWRPSATDIGRRKPSSRTQLAEGVDRGLREIKDKILRHKDHVDDGIDKAGDVMKDKVGHEEQVDQGVEKAKEAVGKLDDN
jgi:hypothetical protein